jgi:polysaccharide pyruvyl transferase WcaK-like protein
MNMLMQYGEIYGSPSIRAGRFWRLANASDLLIIGCDVLDGKYSIDRSQATLQMAINAQRAGILTRIIGFSHNGNSPVVLNERFDWLAQHARLFVRDPVSYKRLHNGLATGLRQAGDLAFLMEPDSSGDCFEHLTDFLQHYENRMICLNAHPWAIREAGTDLNAANIAQCVQLLGREGYGTLLVPHHCPDDLVSLQEIFDSCCDLQVQSCYLVNETLTAAQIKFLAGRCTHVFSARLHLLIAALGMGVPVTGFPYQGKFEGLMQLVGVPDALVNIDVLNSAPDVLCRWILGRIAWGGELKARFSECAENMRRLAMVNYEGVAR